MHKENVVWTDVPNKSERKR